MLEIVKWTLLLVFLLVPEALLSQLPIVKITTETEGNYMGEDPYMERMYYRLNLYHVTNASYFAPDSSISYVSYNIGDTTSITTVGKTTSRVYDVDKDEWKDLSGLVKNVSSSQAGVLTPSLKKTKDKKKILGRNCYKYIQRWPLQANGNFRKDNYGALTHYWICHDPKLSAIAKQMKAFDLVFVKKGVVLEEVHEDFEDGVLVNRITTKVVALELE